MPARPASRTEHPGDAADVIAAIEAAAQVTISPSLHDGLRFARAVLAGPDEAEGLFLTALAADLTRRPFVRARTELGCGEWLRCAPRASAAASGGWSAATSSAPRSCRSRS